MKTERRNSPRAEARWPIILSNKDGIIEGETLNISREGISFCSDDPVSYKEPYQIRLLPPGRSEIRVTGKVTWSDLYGMDNEDNTYCMGVCFMEIQEDDQGWIASLADDSVV